MYMVMLVLDNPQQLDDVLQAWQDVGITGATIAESTGAHRRNVKRIGGRYFMGLAQPTAIEEGHYTLFVIVSNEQQVKGCLAAAEGVTGNLDEPNTGIFAAWQLDMVKGVPE
jgi:nitrogen regulatory protein PII